MRREMSTEEMMKADRLNHASRDFAAKAENEQKDLVLETLKKGLESAIKQKDVLKRAEMVVALKKRGYSVSATEGGVRVTKDVAAPVELDSPESSSSESLVSMDELAKIYMLAYDQHRFDDMKIIQSQIEANGYSVQVQKGKVQLVKQPTEAFESNDADFNRQVLSPGDGDNEFDPSQLGASETDEKLEI